jgi:tetratricopeptide (TPR) repeat protein
VVTYANGGYGLSSRTALAVGIWAVIMIGVAFGLLPRSELSRGALVTMGLLGLFALWTFASMFWAASPEGAFNEFNRVSVYLAILVLALLGTTRRDAGRWADGFCLGIVATAAVALASRFFPHLFSASGQVGDALPNAASRLSFPVGYWNGLGMLVSFGFPLCLRSAVLARRSVVRALPVAALPLLASVVYLTSSRGAAVTAVAGTTVFLLATERRWHAVGAGVAGAIGSAVAIALLVQRGTLVNGPLTSTLADSQGRTAAVLVCGCSLLAGALFVAGDSLLERRGSPRPEVGRVLVTVLLAAVVVGAVAANPIARFDQFKRLPVAQAAGNFTTAHLLSGNGSGRWQFWTAAIDEFRSAPLQGRGAGSYEAWWAQHASFTYFLRNAHSLYFEVLGELGIVGLLLICGSFGAGLATAISRLRTMHGELRVTLAALTAVFVAFLAGAAIDWIWQLTAVGGVALAALGATLAGPDRLPLSEQSPEAASSRGRIGPGIAVLLAAWALICAQAIPWLAAGKISDSQAAVRRGDTGAALANALDAKTLQPWAASPYVQLALVAEQRRELSAARRWIASAIDRDSKDWRTWYLAARIQRESGQPAAAARSFATARSLNPRSPLFSTRSS